MMNAGYDYHYDQPQMGYAQDPRQHSQPPVNVQPAQFQSFDDQRIVIERKNISMIMDVPLQVTVELGRTHKMIKDILEFGPGSIIELDKLAGEPVDIMVNGKPVAKGEVVVIDESFGVRITDIIHPSKRI
jgi:flagellar motor switch protein FliN/FliY